LKFVQHKKTSNPSVLKYLQLTEQSATLRATYFRSNSDKTGHTATFKKQITTGSKLGLLPPLYEINKVGDRLLAQTNPHKILRGSKVQE
jgi:hypothetical protein